MIKLASPDIRPTDIERAVAVIESGQLIQGSQVLAFEEALSSFTSIDACAVVSSGTAALHLALMALGIKQGERVVVPSFTFPATANVVERIGAEVVLCEVDEQRYVLTPVELEATLRSHGEGNIKAVIVVHEFGYPAEVKAIAQITRKFGVKLIEDAACALGTCADGHHPGYFSDVACLSFHPRKAITTGEGGALLSTDRLLIEKIKTLRNHGIAIQQGEMDFVAAGLNYRMTDFQAALAIGQLERFDGEVQRRHQLVENYVSLLDGCPNLLLPQRTVGHSWQSFMVVLEKHVDRNRVIKRMRQRGVEVNLGAQALNCLTYYVKKYGFSEEDFPVATKLFRRGLVLPLYGKLGDNDLQLTCSCLRELLLS